jgi:flagellar assembly factor FliW
MMTIETTRFGQVEVDEAKLIVFPRGLLGFPLQKHYALVQTGANSAFYWLQAVDRPELAFVVTDPRLFLSDYKVPAKGEDLKQLDLEGSDEAQLFVIVNKVDGLLTGNLQGPLVINATTRVGKQLVLSDKRYSTRYPLMQLPAAAPAVAMRSA